MPASAQLDRYAAEIELKGLNVHPRPNLRNETGTNLYGTLDMGWVSHAALATGGCGAGARSRMAGQGPSWLGLRSTEQLGGGWRARVQIEQGIDPASGVQANDCGTPFDRALYLALVHPYWGQLTLGRDTHPAYDVALKADPWAGSGVASPGDAAYYARPVDSAGDPLPGSRFQVRAPQAAGYTSAMHRPLWAQVQVSLAPLSPALAREFGWALHLQSPGLHAAWGYQRWNGNSWAMPASLTCDFMQWRLHAGLTRGQLATGPYANVMLGATVRETQGPFPGHYRVGLNLHRDPGLPSSWKLGLGYTRPLSRHTQVELATGLSARTPAQAQRVTVGASLRHEFLL